MTGSLRDAGKMLANPKQRAKLLAGAKIAKPEGLERPRVVKDQGKTPDLFESLNGVSQTRK